MKRKTFGVLTMVSLLIVLTAVSINAQSKRMTINIPFAFNVADKTLSAGTYTVAPTRQDSQTVWVLENTTDRESVYFTTQSAMRVKSQAAGLVFNRYEDQYFLSQIWSAGEKSGRELMSPNVERRLTIESSTMLLTSGGQ